MKGNSFTTFRFQETFSTMMVAGRCSWGLHPWRQHPPSLPKAPASHSNGISGGTMACSGGWTYQQGHGDEFGMLKAPTGWVV